VSSDHSLDLDQLVGAVARRLTSSAQNVAVSPPPAGDGTALDLPMTEETFNQLVDDVAGRLIELASYEREELPIEHIEI
jgi:hypothetical protein